MEGAARIRGLAEGVRRRRARAEVARRRARAEASGNAPIVIYSLPKTGSSTLHQSLESPRLVRPVHHVHVLSDAGLARVDATLGTPGHRLRPEKQAVMRRARAAIDDPGQRPTVIAATRQPLPRAVSQFFQRWHVDFAWIGDGRPVEDRAIETLLDGFHDLFPASLSEGELWFDGELATVTGVDVFASAFDRERGWQRYDASGSDVAVVRLEDLDRCFGPLTEALFGTAMAIRHTNVATTKPYRDHYDAFVRRLRLTEAETEAVRGARHARHFYAPDEIEATLARHLER